MARPTPQDRVAARLTDILFDQSASPWLSPVFARAMPGVASVLGTSLLAASLGVATPMLTKALIDDGIMARDLNALIFWACVSFGVGLGAVALGSLNAIIHLKASAEMLADLRSSMLGAALARDSKSAPLPIGELASRIDGDSAEIQRFAFDSVLVAIGAVFRLVGGVALMLSLDWRLAFLPLLSTPVELFFLSWCRKETNRRAEEARQARGELSSHLTESLACAGTLQGLGAQAHRLDEFGTLQTVQLKVLARQRLWTEAVGAVSQTITAVTRSIVLLIGGYLVVRGDWPVGSLIAFLAYTGMMSGPLRNLLGLYHAQAKAQVALTRLSGIMVGACLPKHGRTMGQRPSSVSLVAARARHGRHEPVTFSLRAGARVLIDGPSGIGKSQLMALLTRSAVRGSGEVFLGKDEVSELSPATLTHHVTFVEQRSAILRGTLAQNLRLALPSATDLQLWNALDICDLRNWADGHDGLETKLGETGSNMSGGLRQKVALARAVLRPSSVFVFDESFSEIDSHSCTRILGRLDSELYDQILIFIAHAGPVRDIKFGQWIILAPSTVVGTTLEHC